MSGVLPTPPADDRLPLAGLALAAAGSVAFAGKAIIVKLAYRHGVDAVTLLALRMLLSLPMFVLLAWWAGRGRERLGWRDAAVVFGLGFSGYYLASFLDFAGLAYITASLERLILYLTPTLVLAHGWSACVGSGCWRCGLLGARRRPSGFGLAASPTAT